MSLIAFIKLGYVQHHPLSTPYRESVADTFFETKQHPKTFLPLSSYVTGRRALTFMDSNSVDFRTQSGKLSFSPRKPEMIDRETAYHLGQLRTFFQSGALVQGSVRNTGGTH